MNVEHIHDPRHGDLLAILVSRKYDVPGLTFFTDHDQPQQLAYMRWPAGHVCEPHKHPPCHRVVEVTQEVLFVRRGKVRLCVYGYDDEPADSLILEGGDVVILLAGGHGLEFLEESELFESKQGPFPGKDRDKVAIGGKHG